MNPPEAFEVVSPLATSERPCNRSVESDGDGAGVSIASLVLHLTTEGVLGSGKEERMAPDGPPGAPSAATATCEAAVSSGMAPSPRLLLSPTPLCFEEGESLSAASSVAATSMSPG